MSEVKTEEKVVRKFVLSVLLVKRRLTIKMLRKLENMSQKRERFCQDAKQVFALIIKESLQMLLKELEIWHFFHTLVTKRRGI